MEIGEGFALALALPSVEIRVHLPDMLVTPLAVLGINALGVMRTVLLVPARVLREILVWMRSHDGPLNERGAG
ncbi:hypothetical protein ACFSF0_11005 [Ottowia flava]|uniref:Uncharacterized protein n=1 Tax=Ottowia flava TaxID=2675430 RepID=A0ABW4KTM3_9BURK|nr:hypothetical protein [Ottowia sp. GY511]